MDKLLEKLLSQDSRIQEQAIQALINRGELQRGLDFLLQVLKQANTNDSHDLATSALMKIGQPAIPTLVEIVKDHSTEAPARSGAINVLYLIKAPEASEILIFALKDPDPEVQGEAAYGLGELRAKEAFEPLLDAIHDPDPYVRRPIMFALGQIENPEAIEPLIAAPLCQNGSNNSAQKFSVESKAEKRKAEHGIVEWTSSHNRGATGYPASPLYCRI